MRAAATPAADPLPGGAPPAVIDVTEANFQTTVLERSMATPVILDFWASWCGPCRTFGPIFEAASEKHKDVVFGKIDTEAQQGLAAAALDANDFFDADLVCTHAGQQPPICENNRKLEE